MRTRVEAILILTAVWLAVAVPLLSSALGLAADRVSVKATTTEGMGFVGREEGAAASAVVVVSVGEE